MEIGFSRSARKHRIGKVHALFVMAQSEPAVVPIAEDLNEYLLWIGTDSRGVELEIVAVARPEVLLVIHVMPTHYRKRKR